MSIVWIGFCLCCLGGTVLACMTNPRCQRYQNEAMSELMSNNLTEYCRLQSKAIACFSSDVSDCNNSAVLGLTYSAYYNACSLTEGDVADCVGQTSSSCDGLRLNVLLSSDATEYCRNMEVYMTCIKHNMTACHHRVTIFDILGVDFATYEQTCSVLSVTEQCQRLTFTSCASQLQSVANTTRRHEMCSSLEKYLQCLNDSLQHCDPSVRHSDIIGPFQLSYQFQCGVGTSCPAISTCMENMPTSTPSSDQGEQSTLDPSPLNFLQSCSALGDMFSCMDSEFGMCNITSPWSYTFSDLSDLYVSVCQALHDQTDLLTCPHMSMCVSTLPLSADPAEMMNLYIDPAFWCRVLQYGMQCASNMTEMCNVNPTVLSDILHQTNQVCSADVPTTTAAGESSTGVTKESSEEEPTSSGSKLPTSVISLMLVLLTHQLDAA